MPRYIRMLVFRAAGWIHTVLLISAYSKAKFANPYRVPTDTSLIAAIHDTKRLGFGHGVSTPSSISSRNVSSEAFSSSSPSPFVPINSSCDNDFGDEVSGIKGEYAGLDSSVHFRDFFIQRRKSRAEERTSFRNSDMMTRPDDENVYVPFV
jgi:hypothetical protein